MRANWATYTVLTATSPTATPALFFLLFAIVEPMMGAVSSISAPPPIRLHHVDLTDHNLDHSAATAPGSPPPDARARLSAAV
ncbi:hypothetical protein GCM10010346_58920 [Streptomyces chryseus]|uniref:Secreted protein n=1 Tax=Streptomyces chryseus TaxID=68186 RepID=A0ABQ3E9F6_9ACTN|nr:hypothetical protein GCM10010346_58920 [Streptomyces chryseus]